MRPRAYNESKLQECFNYVTLVTRLHARVQHGFVYIIYAIITRIHKLNYARE